MSTRTVVRPNQAASDLSTKSNNSSKNNQQQHQQQPPQHVPHNTVFRGAGEILREGWAQQGHQSGRLALVDKQNNNPQTSRAPISLLSTFQDPNTVHNHEVLSHVR